VTERAQELVELAYAAVPRFIDLIGDRLEDMPRNALTGTTLVLQGKAHRLFLACAGQETAAQVRLRLREFFDTQVRELPGETLEDTLARGFDRVIPGDAFPVWREQGWKGGMTPEEAFRWVQGRRGATCREQPPQADRPRPERG